MTSSLPPSRTPSTRPPPPSSRPPGAHPMVKGLAFRSVIAALGELRGQKAVEAMYEKLWHEDATEIRSNVVAAGWYPAKLCRAMWTAIADATGETEALAMEIGRESMRRDLSGPLRLAFKLISPESALDVSARIFNTYYDTGSVEVVEARTGLARIRFKGCRGFHRWMWMDLLGSAETALEIAGGKNVRLRYAKGALEGDMDAEMAGTWE